MQLNNEQIARVAHEAHRACCQVLGDSSQGAWDDAPQWQRDSALAGVKAIASGEAGSAEVQHQLWMDHKWAAGWSHGPAKDAAAKTHPGLLSYDKLPSEQQLKVVLFRAVVMSFVSRDRDFAAQLVCDTCTERSASPGRLLHRTHDLISAASRTAAPLYRCQSCGTERVCGAALSAK